MTRARILVVEDDPELRSILERGLSEEGFAVTPVATGAAALAAGERHDLLLIDIGLPDADGRDVCQAFRARGVEAPVVFLTARDAVTDRLSGFHSGADDYVTKPFHFDELVLRIHALLRRSATEPETALADFSLDPVKHALRRGETETPLTPTEFRLLGSLASKPGAVLRRRELIAAAWPDGAIVHDNTLDVYIGRLRRKLATAGTTAQLATVHGVGYRLG